MFAFFVPLRFAHLYSSSNCTVSYQEFLGAFRSQTFAKALQLDEGNESFSQLGGEDLLDLDAKIPGGKFDSEVIKQSKVV